MPDHCEEKSSRRQHALSESNHAEPQAVSAGLRGRERELHKALDAQSRDLANLYFGACLVRQQEGNPVRLVLAGHALRELMDKMTTVLSVPAMAEAKPPPLTAEVKNLHGEWEKVKRNSSAAKRCWEGAIDEQLAKFLKKSDEFFARFSRDHPARSQIVAGLLRRLDPSGRPLPTPIERIRVGQWAACFDYFNAVTHMASTEDFENWSRFLELFLIDALLPRTFEDHAEIDAIIEGAKGDD
jgi:hypothetical protein